jgi:hypothetical protein
VGGCGGMKRTFPICSVATAETRTGRRAVDRARAAVDRRGPVTEAPARRAVCCLDANIFFPQLSFASRELARSGPARVVPREVQTWVRSCGAARWCRARCFVEQRVRSRVGNCQFGGGAFFGRLGQKAAGSLPRTTEKRRSGEPYPPRNPVPSLHPMCTKLPKEKQKISYMVIGDETHQIYGLRS